MNDEYKWLLSAFVFALLFIGMAILSLAYEVHKSEQSHSCKDETSWMNDGYSQQWISAALTTKEN